MPQILPDLTQPLDFSYVERVGDDAVCPSCKVWVRISPLYKADRKVMVAIPHKVGCELFNSLLKQGVFRES
jgi:hypothetical protein